MEIFMNTALENILLIQKLYYKSTMLPDDRWRRILLPVYNKILKEVDRSKVSITMESIIK
jgi:hypothetical protein